MPTADIKNQDPTYNEQRPFLGLSSFKEENKGQFGGRDTEIKDLYNLVENHPLTIVFGKSGIGKTSLLQAGLIPELQRNFYLPVYLRIDYESKKSPLQQARDMIYKKFKSKDEKVTECANKTLWEWLHDEQIQDGLMTPVLLFDQFEEAFTLGRKRSQEVLEFILELSDLAENRVPLVVQNDYKSRNAILPARYADQKMRMIISLREDYLAQLESLKTYLPSIKNSRYRIVQMTVIQAMEAILKPARNLIDKNCAEEIIKKLPGITDRDFDESAEDSDQVKRLVVEPFLLSLICFKFNEIRIDRKMDKISPELVRELKIEDITYSFYDDTMKQFGSNVNEGVEISLLTESGNRKLESLEQLQNHYHIDNETISALIDKRIIRQENRDGVEYV